ncbi:MAG: hypothetical protein VW078_09475 [Flavobacteriales bacterium]
MNFSQKIISLTILVCTTFLLVLISCEKENDPRLKYVGDWNFKGNGFSYSGYYDYNVPPGQSPNWISTSSSTTDYNDSTGSILLADNPNELIIKYCESCDPLIYNLSDSGEKWSDNLGAIVGWTLTDSTFFNIISPEPPGYTPSYSTYNIEGWKL